MRCLLLLLLVTASHAAVSAPAGLGAAAAGPDTLAVKPLPVSVAVALQAAIRAAVQQDPGFWSDQDLDQDQQPSQVEIVRCLALHPAFLRTHFPDLFRKIDTDGDRAISEQELLQYAASLPQDRIRVQPHTRRTVRDLTDQQGFDDGEAVGRRRFDAIAGFLPRGTVIEAGPVDILVLR